MTLIERLEAASGADRFLDYQIAVATGWTNGADPKWGIASPHWYNPDKRCITELTWHYGPSGGFLPAFTASLDAAMTLIPKGAAWVLEANDGAAAMIQGIDKWCLGETEALALCIASLKARGVS